MKTQVTILKGWHKPEIEIKATKSGLSVSMDLSDFLTIAFQEAGSIKWKFNDASWKQRVLDVSEQILDRMKDETIKVI